MVCNARRKSEVVYSHEAIFSKGLLQNKLDRILINQKKKDQYLGLKTSNLNVLISIEIELTKVDFVNAAREWGLENSTNKW